MQEIIGTKPSNRGDALKDGEELLNGLRRENLVSEAEHFQRIAFLARSLSDENRLRILQYISGGKKSVTSIVEELSLSQPLVSHHLRELKRSLLVKIERNGPFIYYELSDPRILNVIESLSTVARDLLSARKIF
jgi:ArsR family transcriptional regulator, zinc-responsive transcriptional repressor